MRRTRDDGSGDRHPPEHTVLGRSAAIMEAFNGAAPVLSLADLNKRTRLPKSTLHRLVDQLCQVGWLERDRRRLRHRAGRPDAMERGDRGRAQHGGGDLERQP